MLDFIFAIWFNKITFKFIDLLKKLSSQIINLTAKQKGLNIVFKKMINFSLILIVWYHHPDFAQK